VTDYNASEFRANHKQRTARERNLWNRRGKRASITLLTHIIETLTKQPVNSAGESRIVTEKGTQPPTVETDQTKLLQMYNHLTQTQRALCV